MKKALTILCAMCMLFCSTAYATNVQEMTYEELIALVTELQEQLATYTNPEETEEQPAEEEIPEYVEIGKGSKGEEAKKIQLRLIELGYLTGAADGIYGNGTAAAVSSFQNQHDLPVTGTADVTMQELLFSEIAEKAIVYEKLEYKAASRDPDDYEGRYVKFNGEVLQVIEGEYSLAFLIYVNGDYDQLVRVTMDRPEDYSRILEDDMVVVMGQYNGLYSYETVRGSENTVLDINASLVTLK